MKANFLFNSNSSKNGSSKPAGAIAGLLVLLFVATACTPTIKVEAPDKPIEINMNINIKHEILIRIEKEVEALLDDDIF